MTDVISGDAHTVVFYKTNEDGRRVKVTRTVRSTFVPASTPEERQSWARYAHGSEINVAPKADQEITLTLTPKKDDQPKKATQVRAIKCKICEGPHISAACPMRDKIVTSSVLAAGSPYMGGPPAPTPGKYVSPSRRAATGGAPGAPGALGSGVPANLERFVPPGVRGAGMRPGMGMHSQDSENTLRVSNIPEYVDEMRLRRLFSRVGHVVRCHVSKHHDTNVGRGFAFVAYATHADAERAKQMFNRQPIDHMIMHVDFAQPRTS